MGSIYFFSSLSQGSKIKSPDPPSPSHSPPVPCNHIWCVLVSPGSFIGTHVEKQWSIIVWAPDKTQSTLHRVPDSRPKAVIPLRQQDKSADQGFHTTQHWVFRWRQMSLPLHADSGHRVRELRQMLHWTKSPVPHQLQLHWAPSIVKCR